LDTDTGIGGRAGQFPSTDLSLLAATHGEFPNQALERIVALYWKPVYRFVRLKFRKSNEDAKDLTQSFFGTALEREFFRKFVSSRASFRTYLRMAVVGFAANDHLAEKRQKRGGDVQFEPLEDNDRVASQSAEEIFEHEWRRQLFSLALDDLRAHCETTGKKLQFCIFEEYDLAGSKDASYAELAARHGIAETSVTNHLAWARRMLRAFVTERLREVTSSEGELRKELRQVWS
jgi:RNA polymerase sigma factor (sigma-70 family)